MTHAISRREMLGIAATATAAASGLNWMYTRDGAGNIVVAASKDADEWKPILFSRSEAEAVAALCEAIIPRTDTPGARDARVHEFIDLQLSGEKEPQQKLFLEGLKWLDKRCKKSMRKSIANASPEQLASLLNPISDLHDSHPEDMKTGVTFFGNLKRRTVFGFYTSKLGWVDDLGLPEQHSLNATFIGCPEAEAG